MKSNQPKGRKKPLTFKGGPENSSSVIFNKALSATTKQIRHASNHWTSFSSLSLSLSTKFKYKEKKKRIFNKILGSGAYIGWLNKRRTCEIESEPLRIWQQNLNPLFSERSTLGWRWLSCLARRQLLKGRRFRGRIHTHTHSEKQTTPTKRSELHTKTSELQFLSFFFLLINL